MGIHPVSVTLISGRNNAAEIVVAASVFLEMHYAPIRPISITRNIRDDFFLALENFRIRESFMHFRATYYVQNMITPNDGVVPFGDVCLALDEQGYSIAQEAFSKIGMLPEEKVYDSTCCKLNLIEREIPPYPEIQTTSEYWEKIMSELNRVGWEYRRTKSQKGRRALFEKHVPMGSIEKEFYSWHKSVYDSVIPWKEIFGAIISAWS